MAVLIDTSILVRLADVLDPQYPVAALAIARLHRSGESVHITPQNLVEFRSVATRPLNVNGLGFSSSEADRESANFEAQFLMLDDSPDVFAAWKAVVSSLGIVGKQVHDARLVAVCHVRGVPRLLTFNDGHFTRMANSGPGLVVLHPSKV